MFRMPPHRADELTSDNFSAESDLGLGMIFSLGHGRLVGDNRRSHYEMIRS